MTSRPKPYQLKPGLPQACPLITRMVPKACRFAPRLFFQLLHEGVLPIDDDCPYRGICKLYKRRKR